MENKYLPGFTVAGPNAYYLNAEQLDGQQRYSTVDGQKRVLYTPERLHLNRARSMAHRFEEITIAQLPSKAPRTWNELDAIICQDINNQIDQVPDTDPPTANKQAVKYAARAGIAQIIAINEVVPQVFLKHDYTNPNLELAAKARCSIGLAIGMMSLADSVDGDLVYALSYPKADLSAVHPYDNLRFHPKWFEPLGNGMGLRRDKQPDLRGTTSSHPLQGKNHQKVIFGCPARKLVPQIYTTVVNAAEAADLYANTYHAARRNIGY